MANEITGASLATDQEKMLAATLIQRSYLKLVLGACCEKVQMKEGAGLVAHFVRYKRMQVPLTPLSDDGQDPANSTFSNDEVTVTLDEWGDKLTITNVAQLTTKHPVVQEAMRLLADNAARVMDREIGIVLLAGTNVQYSSGVPTSRGGLATTDIMTSAVIHKARATLVNAGAPPKGGPPGDARQVTAQGSVNDSNLYLAVCGPEVLVDLMAISTSLGTWASVAMYANQKALYNAEVATFLGMRWVESNFLPRFRILGNTTTAVASGAAFGTDTPIVTAVNGGGTLLSATTYFYKVTRKDLNRGYEEDISIEHSTASAATGDNESFTFNFSSLTAGFVYNLYFGSATGDANLKLASSNIAVGTTITVTAVPSSTTTPPASNSVTGPVTTVYPVFVFAEAAVNWVGFYGIRTYISQDVSTPENTLRRRRTIGYSFFGKAMIRDQTRLLRIEVASTLG